MRMNSYQEHRDRDINRALAVIEITAHWHGYFNNYVNTGMSPFFL